METQTGGRVGHFPPHMLVEYRTAGVKGAKSMLLGLKVALRSGDALHYQNGGRSLGFLCGRRDRSCRSGTGDDAFERVKRCVSDAEKVALVACGHCSVLKTQWDALGMDHVWGRALCQAVCTAIDLGHGSGVMEMVRADDRMTRMLEKAAFYNYEHTTELLAAAMRAGLTWIVDWLEERSKLRLDAEDERAGAMESYPFRALRKCRTKEDRDHEERRWKDTQLFAAAQAGSHAELRAHFAADDHAVDLQRVGSQLVSHAAAAHGSNAVELITWLFEEQGVRMRNDHDRRATLANAAKNGNIQVLDHLHSNMNEFNPHFGTNVCDWAAIAGQTAALEWLVRETREDPSSIGMSAAVANGHMAVVRWLHQKRSIAPERIAVHSTASRGTLDAVATVEYVVRQGLCDVTERTCINASTSAHISPPLLRFLANFVSDDVWTTVVKQHPAVQADAHLAVVLDDALRCSRGGNT